MASQYDPPSEHVLATIRAEVRVSLAAAAANAEKIMRDDPAIEVRIPPLITEDDIHYRCRDDWRGGDPGPGIDLVLGTLAAAGIIRPVAEEVRLALVASNERKQTDWHSDYRRTWEVVKLRAALRRLPAPRY